MVKYMYKTLDGITLNQKPENFNGYEIKKENVAVSKITEYKNGEELGTIVFRPTKIPVIFSVKYPEYYEERYSNGRTSCKYYRIDKQLFGEYRRYDAKTAEVIDIQFFDKGKNVTDDIRDLLKIKTSMLEHIFTEEEKFNIMVNYGSTFKFLEEFDIPSTKFDNIMEYCLK